MSEQTENQIQKEIQKIIPAIYYNKFFKDMSVVRLNENKIIFGLNGTSAITVKKHIENKYIDQLGLAVANSIGKRKVELIVLEKLDTTKPIKQSDKIDYDGEVHKLESYIKEHTEIRYNEVSQNLEHKVKGGKNFHIWTDRDFADLYLNITRLKEYKYASKDRLFTILNSSFIPNYHPIKEYFNSLEEWDKKTDWIGKVCSCLNVSNDMEFRKYFEKWCIRAVYSLFSETDFSNEHCLIIQSAQGWYKSSFINGLIPKQLKPYYNSRIPEDLRSKDMVVAASKIWIWFLDEIDKITSKRDAADLRDFLSSKGSFERASYARNAQHFSRITNFLAACNKVEFLVDDTGNRRFIIFSLAEPILIDKFQKIPIEKFWSQVFQLYKNTRWNQIHWTSEEQKQIQGNNLQYEYINNDYEIILKYFKMLPLNQYNPKNKNHRWMSATDIYLFINGKHPNFKMNVRWLGRGLASLKFERKRSSDLKQFLVEYHGDDMTSFSQKH